MTNEGLSRHYVEAFANYRNRATIAAYHTLGRLAGYGSYGDNSSPIIVIPQYRTEVDRMTHNCRLWIGPAKSELFAPQDTVGELISGLYSDRPDLAAQSKAVRAELARRATPTEASAPHRSNYDWQEEIANGYDKLGYPNSFRVFSNQVLALTLPDGMESRRSDDGTVVSVRMGRSSRHDPRYITVDIYTVPVPSLAAEFDIQTDWYDYNILTKIYKNQPYIYDAIPHAYGSKNKPEHLRDSLMKY